MGIIYLGIREQEDVAIPNLNNSLLGFSGCSYYLQHLFSPVKQHGQGVITKCSQISPLLTAQ